MYSVNTRTRSMENLEAIQDEVDEVVFQRALHCISEDLRTLAAVEALAAGDFKRLGDQMTRSHASLQEHFEVRRAQQGCKYRQNVNRNNE